MAQHLFQRLLNNFKGEVSWSNVVVFGTIGIFSSIFFVYPLIILLVTSLTSEEFVGFSLANYVKVYTDPRLLTALQNTLIVAFGSSALATLQGVSLAWIIARTNMPLRKHLEPLNLIPFFLSPLIGALAWKFLAAPKIGMLNSALMWLFALESPVFNIYSLGGLIWVTALFFTPIVYLFTVGTFRSMDPRLEEASRVSGHGILQTTLRVTLPLATPAILSGFLIVFVSSAGIVSIPLILGAPYKIETLSTQIYEFASTYPPDFNTAAAIGGVLIIITSIGVLIQRRIIYTTRFITITGRGYQPNIVDLGKWKYVALGYNMAYLLFVVFLPLLALTLVSMSAAWLGYFEPAMFDPVRNYATVFSFPITQRSIINSFILAIGGATIGVMISIINGYFITRGRGRSKTILELFVTLPIAIAGIVVGLSFLIGFIRTPIYGTLWVLLLAYVIRFNNFSLRPVISHILSVDPELEESSRVCGVSLLQTIRRVLLPLIRPGILAGWLLLFIIYLREIEVSIVLFGQGTEVMSVVLAYFNEFYFHGVVAAFALVQALILLVIAYIFLNVVGTKGLAL